MLEKAVFDSKLANPTTFTLQEKLDIQNSKAHYPYCALLQMLDLLSDKAANIYEWDARFTHKVSLHLPDVSRLASKLAAVHPTDISTPGDLRLKEQIEDVKKKEYDNAEEEQAFDIFNEINAYQEVSFKTAPRSVILEKFLEESHLNTAAAPDETPEKVVELGKQSLKPTDDIETETLALILEKQGKFDKAIHVYEHLCAKQPDKAAEYAARIDALKNKMEDNNNNNK
ncbi:MAG: hypothetical protein SPJ13_07605 [Bacteroidales bacterium]|nr:hypothetical protein [Bacteroidales bacterium]